MSYVFKIREYEKTLSCDASFRIQTDTAIPSRQKIILDYILQHAQGDKRPYLSVSIGGIMFNGLLDSGASRTILGQTGWDMVKLSGVVIKPVNFICTMGNGSKSRCLGIIQVTVRLINSVKLIDILVGSKVPQNLI